MKKLLVIVPHQDDDISIAGALLAACCEPRAEYEPFVLFTTNGDGYKCDELIRLREAQHALSVLGMDTQHIMFLGYPGSVLIGKVLYDCRKDDILVNHGRKETYGLPDAPEYRFLKSGVHSSYTLENYRRDLHDLLIDILPDCIVVNNYDWHPDHRMTYLTTLEAVRQLIVEQPCYKPLLLTKYAYANNWLGKSDYFEKPLQPTLQTDPAAENPEARWQDRLCFAVPDCCKTPKLRQNLLFQSIKCYVSQQAWIYAPRFLNSDVCYWRKRTENLALSATVTATSGRADYANDFKVIDSSKIFPYVSMLDQCVWIPDAEDKEKTLELYWKKPISVNSLVLYESASSEQHIRSLRLQLDNGFCVENIEPAPDGGATEIKFTRQKEIQKVRLTLIDTVGTKAGLSEVEVFDGYIPLEHYSFPLEQIPHQTAQYRKNISAEKYLFQIQELLCKKLFPNIYEMRRRYPILCRCTWLLPALWLVRLISFPIKKLREKRNE